MTAPKRRLRSCVEEWPDAETGAYHPRCCRFPKSCSATVYSDSTPDEDLEPAGKNRCRGDRDCPAEEHIEGCFASAAPETYTWQVHEVPVPLGHEFIGVDGHPDDDECTHRADGTDATYCGRPEEEHLR